MKLTSHEIHNIIMHSCTLYIKDSELTEMPNTSFTVPWMLAMISTMEIVSIITIPMFRKISHPPAACVNSTRAWSSSSLVVCAPVYIYNNIIIHNYI